MLLKREEAGLVSWSLPALLEEGAEGCSCSFISVEPLGQKPISTSRFFGARKKPAVCGAAAQPGLSLQHDSQEGSATSSGLSTRRPGLHPGLPLMA